MNSQTTQFIRENADKTAAEIVSLLTAQPPLTVSPIPLASLGPLLRKIGLMSALKLIVADTQVDARLRAGVADFLDQLADQRQVNLDTTDETIAIRAAAVLDGLAPVAEANKLDPAVITSAIYSLGGGLKYSLVTESEVRAVLDQIQAVNAQLALEQRVIAAYNAAMAAVQGGEADAGKVQAAFDSRFVQ